MSALISVVGGEVLTEQERQLLGNFRATTGSARQFLVDMSAEYKRTLPAEPVRLQLAHSAPTLKHQSTSTL